MITSQITLSVSAALLFAAAIYAWRHRLTPGTKLLIPFLGAAILWSLGYAMEIGSAAIDTKFFWAKVQYPGVVATPTLLFLLINRFLKQDNWLSNKRNMLLFAAEPLVILLLFWTTEYHGLVWKEWGLLQGELFSTLDVSYGWFFWVHVVYAYSLLILSVFLLLRALIRAEDDDRPQIAILLTSALIPWVGNILYIFDFSPYPNLDLTPFSFSLMGLFITLGFFQPNLSENMAQGTEFLISPHKTILSESEQQRARLLASSLALLIPLLFIPELIRATSNPNLLFSFIPAVVGIFVAYVLSRTRYFFIGIPIALIVLSALPVISILGSADFDPDRLLNSLIWSALPLILGSLLLRPRNIFILFSGITASFFLIPLVIPEVRFTMLITPISFNLASTVLLFFVANVKAQNERKLAEKSNELEINNDFLENILNSLSNPFYVIDVSDYSIVLANKAARDLGVHNNKTCYALTHQRDIPCSGLDHPCPLARVVDSKETYVVEHIHYTPEGEPYYAEVHGYPILDELGNVTQMIEYSIDITKRKLAEQEIYKLNLAISTTATAIVITSSEGVFEYVNAAFTKMTGYTVEDVIGQNSNLLRSGQHPPEFYQNLWKTILRGETWRGEIVNRRKDGSLYTEEQTITPVSDERGNIIQFVAVKIDVTQRKVAEETIRKLSEAVEQSASTIVITDIEGNIEYANPAFTEVTGYSIDEAMGQNPRILKSGEMPPEIYQEMWTTLLKGETWTGELINKKKDESHYWEKATISPVIDEDNSITHYVAVKDDITLQKKLEADLVESRDQAIKANALKSQILANVSHDMRTPIGAILGYVDMLQQNVYGEITDAQHDTLTTIIESANQMLDFVNNLLAQSEIESGEVKIHLTSLAPSQLVSEISSIIKILADRKGLDLSTYVDPNLPDLIIGDRYWLQRIITNLASNAIKFTEQGTIDVALIQRDKNTWGIRVTDTGRGISLEKQKSIFLAFNKGDIETTENRGGVGLGLSIVKEITQLMGGEVAVISEPGKGSTFTVSLPIQTPNDMIGDGNA